jgi:hypothetical protein
VLVPDQDSVSFHLMPSMRSGNDFLNYYPGYSFRQPIISDPPVSINPVTGDLLMHPVQIDVGVIAYSVEEYRNGVLIGRILRDYEFTVDFCTDSMPALSGINQTNNFYQTICAGVPDTIEISSSDSDTQDSLSVTLNNTIPNSTLTSTTGPRPVIQFIWTPTLADIRAEPYIFTVNVEDDECQIHGAQSYSYAIYVDVCSSTNELFRNFTLLISPNPSEKFIDIHFPDFIYQETTLRITDALGHLLHEELINGREKKNLVLSIENWNKGVYFLLLNNAEGCAMGKLVKE